jgi:hypothetical protein
MASMSVYCLLLLWPLYILSNCTWQDLSDSNNRLLGYPYLRRESVLALMYIGFLLHPIPFPCLHSLPLLELIRYFRWFQYLLYQASGTEV